MSEMFPVDGTIEIVSVASRAERRQFFDLPFQLHRVWRRDPNWVPPLRSMEEKRFHPSHAWFSHGRLQMFIARARVNGKTQCVGRIVAAVNDELVQRDGPIGLFGYFETVENFEVAKALLDAACHWLSTQKMTTARSSIDFSKGNGCFFSVDAFDVPPQVAMPYTPRYYMEFMERDGWTKWKDAYAYEMPLEISDQMPDGYEEYLGNAYRMAQSHGVTFRPLRRGRGYEEDASALYDFIFQTMEFDGPEKDEFIADISVVRTPFGLKHGILFAFDGPKIVGVLMALPDYNQILIHLNGRLNLIGCLKALYYWPKVNQGRLVILGALPEYRRKGVAMGLVYLLGKWSSPNEKRKFAHAEMSYVFEDNKASRAICELSGGEICKTYRVYEKRL
jgi:GNAT superfamily N-acetyltransferase